MCINAALNCDIERTRLLNIEQQLMNSSNSDAACSTKSDDTSKISNNTDPELGQHTSPTMKNKFQSCNNKTGKGGKEKIASAK